MERLTVLSLLWWERVGPSRLLIGSEVGYCTWETRIAFFFAATLAPGFVVNVESVDIGHFESCVV